jgi:hypothetical protein
MLKKISLTALLSITGLFTAHADGWIGYMSVFENNAGAQGGFVFGSTWGVPDIKTTIVTDVPGTYIGDQLRLQPNFQAYNPGDPFWSDGQGGGNKFMEANTYVEFGGISQPFATFAGTVNSYTLDSAYTALAFIKVLNPAAGWSLDVFETFDLSAGGSFALASDLTAHQGKVLQLGFLVQGLNANPINEAALGSALVTVIPEPSTYALLGGLLVLGLAGWRRATVRR